MVSMALENFEWPFNFNIKLNFDEILIFYAQSFKKYVYNYFKFQFNFKSNEKISLFFDDFSNSNINLMI